MGPSPIGQLAAGRRLMSRRAVLLGAAASLLTAGCGEAAAGSATPATTAPPASGPFRISDGPDESQCGDLLLPANFEPSHPVVVTIHGGGWETGSTLDTFAPYAAELMERGVAVWNIEYRLVGNGGGWPMTFQDVAAAVDALAGPVQGDVVELVELPGLDHESIVDINGKGWQIARDAVLQGI